ncbi:ribulose-phosphate 3-epimerase [Robertmurraya korlensis]|uniref:ribulose-phosphate 3-epimerase n=1 Tax=Robertmurraya korlensis TaxID=519977 RepID=UPI0020405C08|nr:ribulose-phosphate 3-epimerase [Robertmurraya korlensis]MCM3602599.1 ribulose-phosphate 3-epimerase [Robertmurraya korlensis]
MKIAPSILAADFCHLEDQMKLLEQSNISMLHIDVMDGNFVPNITFGPDQIKMLRQRSKLIFDVHLMVQNPDWIIPIVAEAGADIITIHQEATTHLHRSLQLIKKNNTRAGVVLNPATPIETIKHVLDEIDMILLMTVNPGYGGQSFISSVLPKIQEAKKLVEGRNIDIEVDGGINLETAQLCVESGANVIVAGSYTFHGDVKENLEQLTRVINKQGATA